MPEFLKLLSPDEARAVLLEGIGAPAVVSESIDAASALHRVTAEDILAPHPLPEFARASVDGYAVRAKDTFGATDSAPAYLRLVGEIAMGRAAEFSLEPGTAALIHTGGMLPPHADAAVMLEHTQSVQAGAVSGRSSSTEIEVLKPVAVWENVIRAGEDVKEGQVVISAGVRLRPAEIGGLMALGKMSLRVAKKPKVGIISTGDEIVAPSVRPGAGQVRDVNMTAMASLTSEFGGEPILYGIVPDDEEEVKRLARAALQECDVVLISGGSSASVRDTTADVIQSLGKPGVVVHGVNIRPGKPTILGLCGGKAVIGLPGNPVSALVIGYLFLVPLVDRLLGLAARGPAAVVSARLTVNLSSQAGREDWWPVKLEAPDQLGPEWLAEPIFGKSNLIFSLANAAGLIRIPAEANGLAAGEIVAVHPI